MGKIIEIGYSFYELFFMFLFWGMVGWLIEVVDMRIEAGEFQNRGFLHVPFCPLYGIGMLMLNILLRNKRGSYLLLFLSGVIVCTFVEYIVGWLLETFFNAKWWDYSHMRFQVKGRICLRNSILFGFGTIFVISVVQPIVEMAIQRIPVRMGRAFLFAAAFVLIIDLIVSIRRALCYRKKCDDGVFVIFKSHR